MFYHFTVRFSRDDSRQDFFFERYENAYAFTNARARNLTGANPGWTVATDRETRDFNNGTYYRKMTILREDHSIAAKLTLTGEYFEDALVEQFPDHFLPSDFPPQR